MPRWPLTTEERFWSKVTKTDDHWLWGGQIGTDGYGRFYRDGRKQMAHRVAYELLVVAPSADLDIDHLCRTPLCVRPEYPEPVTHRENILRGLSPIAAQARQSLCIRGHELTVRVYSGERFCRTCATERQRQYRDRVKAALNA